MTSRALRDAYTRRLARLATDVVVRVPTTWRLFRGPVRRAFHRLAPHWDRVAGPERLAPVEAALALLERPPRRVLDVGTGTGGAAVAAALRFPDAEVVGVDLAPAMVEEARRRLPPELAARVRFERADAARLPFVDGGFDLVTLANMIPFFDEVVRVLAPGGTLVVGFGYGAETPIYVAPDRLRAELGRRGLGGFRELAAGLGTVVLAGKPGSG